jgi:MYXO-CTERM domain-containing protein
MNPTLRAFSLVTAALVAFNLPAPGRAAGPSITYRYQGVGSGTLGGTPFTNATFTITGIADLAGVQPWSAGLARQNTHLSTHIDIAGRGSFAILTPAHTWSIDPVSTSTWGGLGQNLTFNWITFDDPAFEDYPLNIPLGPILETNPLHVGQFSGVDTSGGVLNFSGITRVTFTALVPEPTALALAGLAAVGLRRRRKCARSARLSGCA